MSWLPAEIPGVRKHEGRGVELRNLEIRELSGVAIRLTASRTGS